MTYYTTTYYTTLHDTTLDYALPCYTILNYTIGHCSTILLLLVLLLSRSLSRLLLRLLTLSRLLILCDARCGRSSATPRGASRNPAACLARALTPTCACAAAPTPAVVPSTRRPTDRRVAEEAYDGEADREPNRDFLELLRVRLSAPLHRPAGVGRELGGALPIGLFLSVKGIDCDIAATALFPLLDPNSWHLPLV